MPMHSRVSTDASVGTTIGTFDAVDTRNASNVLPDRAQSIVGFMFAGGNVGNTAATAFCGILRAKIEAIGWESDMQVGFSGGGGVATNSPGYFVPAEFMPVDLLNMPNLAGSTVKFYFAQAGIEPGDNWSVVASPCSIVGSLPPTEWLIVRACNSALPPHISKSSIGGTVTTGGTAVSAGSITKPAGYNRISSIRLLMIADAAQTAAEEAVGYGDLAAGSNTVSGLSPLEIPMSALSACLGTTVDGVGGFQPWLPLWSETAIGEQTLDAMCVLTTTLTAADATAFGLGFRRA